MLPEQTMEKLYAMKLNGLADAWQEQRHRGTVLNFIELGDRTGGIPW